MSDGWARPGGARFLAEHFPDRPLSLLPRPVVVALGRRWARRRDVFYLLAEADGRPAGFVFAQAVGERPWRSLLKDWRALPFLPFILAAQRFGRLPQGASQAEQARSDEAALPPLDGVAADLADGWRRRTAANVEFIYVSPDMRGRRVGALLLDALARRLAEAGLTRCYAYIAHGNDASRGLFTKAGFAVYRGPSQMRAYREL